MISYRPFHNTDPPAIAAIWNECFTGRGACILRMMAPLERSAFGKLFFDPAGLIVAVDGSIPVGFVHAGFGPAGEQPPSGVICALGVRPSHRNCGIGSQLVQAAEEYLRRRGAGTVLAGPARPNNPFYFGIYGGGDSPGFLRSDAMAAPFFVKRGYAAAREFVVLQRRLDKPISIASDPRAALLRKRCDVTILPHIEGKSWWVENIIGAVEPFEMRLEDRGPGVTAGRACFWEMELFSWRWNAPSVGLLDLTVPEDLRRQGRGRFLLAALLRYFQQQCFTVCECHVQTGNEAARALLTSLGFEPADVGDVFFKSLTTSAAVPTQDGAADRTVQS